MVVICAGWVSVLVARVGLLLDATAGVVVVVVLPLEASLARCLSNLSCSICARPESTGGRAVEVGAASMGGRWASSVDSDSGLKVTLTGGCSFIEAAIALIVSTIMCRQVEDGSVTDSSNIRRSSSGVCSRRCLLGALVSSSDMAIALRSSSSSALFPSNGTSWGKWSRCSRADSANTLNDLQLPISS